MKEKKEFKMKLFFVVLITAVVSFGILFFLFEKNSGGFASTSSIILSNQEASGVPVHLRIPSISVDAQVLAIGKTKEGNIGVPKGPDEVAWYSQGLKPGENGNAIFSGHYGWKDNRPAVFDNLQKIKEDDMIYVQDDTGKQIPFIVTKKHIYGKDENPPEIFAQSDTSHIVLITCTGSWNAKEQSYSERLVVFADRDTQKI